MQSLLIKDTTRAQREEIVRRALSVCGDDCDGCNGCGNTGGGRVDSIYQPYIDGEKELAEINAAYAAGRKPVRKNGKGERWPMPAAPLIRIFTAQAGRTPACRPQTSPDTRYPAPPDSRTGCRRTTASAARR